MTEHDHVELIRKMFPDPMRGTPEALAAVNKAVQLFPDSAALWFLHGQVTMASEDDSEEVPRIAARSFERSLQLDPNCSATHQALAIYFDGIAEDSESAMKHFRRAAELRGEALDV